MPEYYGIQYRTGDGDKLDRDIYEYILQNAPEDYSDILKNDSRWDVFQNLNPMRKSLFNWYNFDENTELLEIGGGFGALTSLFCEKCKHVTTVERKPIRAESIRIRCKKYDNLDIYALDIREYYSEKKFDIIILVGILEKIGKGKKEKDFYINFLKYIIKFLKPAGKLLVAVDNRYGLQNFCGVADKYTGIPFAGINGYPEESQGYTFDRMEIKAILEKAGISNTKFYYPLPDYKNPQLIYSERYLHGSSIRERMVPYYYNKESLVANQMDLYVDIMRNNALEFMANSFLIEGSIAGNLSDIIFACMSTDRGKENGFVTTIQESDVVRKSALYEEGKHNLKNVYMNALEIKSQGIPVIEQTWMNDGLNMPYVHALTVSEYLIDVFDKDTKNVIPVFEKLYVYICQSSEHSMAEDNIMLKKENVELDWGPILSKAYIDMVPANAFYIDGKMYFFDQEFTVSNIPAKYVLYRAIKYTYVYVQMAELVLPIEKVKEYFRLTEVWEWFEKYERKFIRQNRKTDEYAQFYKWSKIDRKRIKQNAEKLLLDEKKTIENNIILEENNIQTLQIHKKLLELLKSFITICEEHSLNYFLFYGSLLGAVRHKGFIPWDDDLDIAMPRNDYEKFREVMEIETEKIYEFQCPENESNCFYGGYGKFRDKRTTAIDRNNWGHECNLGIYIDIFPIDGVASNNKLRTKAFNENKRIQKMLFAKVYGSNINGILDIPEREWKFIGKISNVFTFSFLYNKLVNNIKENKLENSDYVGILMRYYAEEKQQRFFPKKFFDEYIMIEFEGMMVRVPKEYEQCLITLYGRKYMDIPVFEKRKKHENLYDIQRPYEYYMNRVWKYNTKNKKIVLYGTGEIAEQFIKKYGKPVYMVDPDKGLWGRIKYGVLIKPPETLGEVLFDEQEIVICMQDVGKAERRLNKIGVNNYFIYYPFEVK